MCNHRRHTPDPTERSRRSISSDDDKGKRTVDVLALLFDNPATRWWAQITRDPEDRNATAPWRIGYAGWGRVYARAVDGAIRDDYGIVAKLYVRNFSRYANTYGSLAAVVVLLLWLMLSAWILLFGAKVNTEALRSAGLTLEPWRQGA